MDEFSETYQSYFVVKKVNIRGIGNEQLVGVLKKEFDDLSDADKENFIDV